ncbi:MAG: hypothetical protein UW70_C0044G0002 [Candidatus Peregrinibacteria bacterium GW2011_GWA2_44_7]|nr:MAG: hypothetical protein UW70_C0044G0002 [Candidatus Peregrinibacteria bacterium GW2011_GWA2_44_7]
MRFLRRPSAGPRRGEIICSRRVKIVIVSMFFTGSLRRGVRVADGARLESVCS